MNNDDRNRIREAHELARALNRVVQEVDPNLRVGPPITPEMPPTERERLCVLLAWERGEITEGQALEALGVDRLDVRTMKADAIEAGVRYVSLRTGWTPPDHPNPKDDAAD